MALQARLLCSPSQVEWSVSSRAVCRGPTWRSATFILVQLFTVIGFLALALLDAVAALVVLPLIGLVVQGSTTVSYGSVADFVKPRYQARGYALIYSFSAGSAVVGPIALGGLADVSGLNAVLWVLILLTLLTLLFARVLPNKESVRLAEGAG